MSAEAQTPQYITRKDYMSAGDELFVVGLPGTQQSPEFKKAKKKAHQDYYRQFVTDGTLAHVRTRFGIEALAAAMKADENLNSISLEVWDRLTWHPTNENPRPGQYTSASGARPSSTPATLRSRAMRAATFCMAGSAARSRWLPQMTAATRCRSKTSTGVV